MCLPHQELRPSLDPLRLLDRRTTPAPRADSSSRCASSRSARALLDHAVHPGLLGLGRSEQRVTLFGEDLDPGVVLALSKIEGGLEIFDLQFVTGLLDLALVRRGRARLAGDDCTASVRACDRQRDLVVARVEHVQAHERDSDEAGEESDGPADLTQRAR